MCRWKLAATAALILISFIGAAAADNPGFHPPEFGVIVEFRDPPLVELRGGNVRQAMANYGATFQRFREDLATIVNGRTAAKSATGRSGLRSATSITWSSTAPAWSCRDRPFRRSNSSRT